MTLWCYIWRFVAIEKNRAPSFAWDQFALTSPLNPPPYKGYVMRISVNAAKYPDIIYQKIVKAKPVKYQVMF